MYLPYWSLGEPPFRASLDARFFHQGMAQDEALARLQFLVDERRTLGLLLGPSGSGKSMLLEVFAGGLPRFGLQRALVNLADVDLHEFLWNLSGQLGIEVPSTASRFTLSRAVVDHLLANRYQQITTVLLLDDADLARGEVQGEIARLVQLDADRDAWLTIALSAQSSRIDRLDARLVQWSELRIDLDGWEADETAAFVKQSLATAGRTTPVFSEAALARLHEQSGGIPRRVKQLADLALLAGAGQNMVQIETDTIDSVIDELGLAGSPVADAAASFR